MAREINLTEVVFTSSHVRMAGRYTLEKLADNSARGIMNTFSLSNISIQIRHLPDDEPYETIIYLYFCETLPFLTLRLLMSYIYGAPSKARNANVVYIWTYVWQR